VTITSTDTSAIPELDGGPYELEFFFDPGCPFAWQTAVWIRRVAELRRIEVGWRFISLLHINAAKDLPAPMRDAQLHSRRYQRVCAAARARIGNHAVGQLYRAFGERVWYERSDAELPGRFVDVIQRVDVVEVLAALGLPADLAAAADDESWDAVIVAESDEAFRRTGPDVGTPIISFDPPSGVSLFGPVISDVPADDETALALHDALRTFARYPGFAELKRTARPPLDLPLFRPA
jgi:2-hydroxychromene-2-carboxylate isomerase